METCEECGRPNHAGGGRDAEAHCYGTDTVECVRHALTRERATVARLTGERDRAVRHSTDMESRMWAAVTRAEAAELADAAATEHI